MATRSGTLGARLKQLRTQLGVTQVDLAKALGVGQTALSHMEDRDEIRASKVVEYLEALGGRVEISAQFGTLGRVQLFESGEAHDGEATGSDGQLALPGFDVEPRARDVVLSIKPTYADQILAGNKTVEVRRRFTVGAAGAWALIYSTTPDRALTGAAKIDAVQYLPLSTLWRRYKYAACLAKSDFDDYFTGTEAGYAISLKTPIVFDRRVSLADLRKRFGFEPPQSYQYATPQLSRLVGLERAKAIN